MDNISNVFKNTSKPDVIVFLTQVVVLLVVVITCLFNLTMYPESETKRLWVTFLTGSLGYLMPNPKFKMENNETKDVPAVPSQPDRNGDTG